MFTYLCINLDTTGFVTSWNFEGCLYTPLLESEEIK